jgi:predicted aminopeptidase
MRARVAGLFAALVLAGCATIEYYAQAIGGHLDLVRRAQRIEERLRDPDTPGELRAWLERVLAIREFASRELTLPDNGSYRRYADIGRPFVVWNVYAAPEFAVKAAESCFPVAGCVVYRGFYAEADAQEHARRRAAEGFDVFVAGVPAYSTLGWFDDPVLSTLIGYPDAELARLLFHELAHQVAYARDDSVFNESFAVAVEEEGVRRWLARNGAPGESARYEAAQERKEQFIALLARYRARLARDYAQTSALAARREGKARLFGEMAADYGKLKASWGGFAGYDRFFAQGANNALLASVATYTDLLPGFRALLSRNSGDLRVFYGEVKELARLEKRARAARLGL